MNQMDGIKLSRIELHQMVWAESMLSLSRRYDISDVGLRKICKRMNIPVPSQEYRQGIKAGFRLPVKRLPENYSGEEEVVLHLRFKDTELADGRGMTVKELEKSLQEDGSLNMTVPLRLSKPDKLIVRAKENLNKRHNWSPYSGVVTTSHDALNLRVSPKNVGRALRIMDTFIKAIKAKGYTIQIRRDGTYVLIDNQEVKFSLRELVQRDEAKDKWGSRKYYPTGILSFKLENWSSYEVKEGNRSLEEQLPRIIAKAIFLANQSFMRREKYKREEEIRQEKFRIEMEHILRKEKERERVIDLLNQSQRWQKATILRKYLSAVKTKLSKTKQVSQERRIWLEWAEKKANWYDPLIEAEDELLADVNKDNFSYKK